MPSLVRPKHAAPSWTTRAGTTSRLRAEVDSLLVHDTDTPSLIETGGLAPAEGLPYQTLISSLLHKYASGRLKEV
jgi:hypothetical protein